MERDARAKDLQARAEGREERRQEGRQEGRAEGELVGRVKLLQNLNGDIPVQPRNCSRWVRNGYWR